MLTPIEMARRAAREAQAGDRVHVGSGLAGEVRGFLPEGVQIVPNDNGSAAVDVAFLGAQMVCDRGDLVPVGPTNGGERCDWPDAATPRAKRTVALLRHEDTDGKANLIGHRSRKDNTFPERKALRVITDLAVVDITDQGMVLDEVAPGVSAREVQRRTEARLLAGPDLGEIDLEP
jgi:3-oxoacid CoA-transferase subunit B